MSVIGGVAALALAGWGEVRIEAEDQTWVGVLLVLLGIGAFVLSAYALGPAPVDLPAETPIVPASSRRRDIVAWVGLVLGAGLALVLNVAALRDLWGRWDSTNGLLLWGASLAAITFTAITVGRQQAWPARWGTRAYPSSWSGRILLVIAVLAIIAVASASRLLWLDKVPLGINPDEGDRASTAIRILRGEIRDGVFDYGWFSIHILYFWVLGQVMKVAGLTFAGARVFGALSGIATVATVTWMGMRHFGYRVGVMAGALLAVLGIALQFARETTEATPTAFLWTLSAAALLEAARRGRSFSWVLAGVAGGLSVYFYPTGRLWPLIPALFSLYLVLNGLGTWRRRIVHGVVLAAIAAALTISPFLLRAKATNWESFTMRARYTSIFAGDNKTRLLYYRPEWTMARLLREQVQRSVGILNRYADRNGFWPTERPLMWGPLAVLTVIGLGWICLRPRDPRFVLLAIWFWVGLSGVIVTVETPNVQRMATAIPVIAFLPALVLDSLVRRLEGGLLLSRLSAVPVFRQAPTTLALLVVALLMVQQWRFYFYTYGPMDEWSAPTLMGHVVADQGPDTQVFSLGRQWHISNQGWVRLLAAETPRGGLPSPGYQLPVALPPDHNLAFMVMPELPFYLPYLQSLYPGGTTTPAIDHGQKLFTMYRVSKEQRSALQGALAVPPQGTPVNVPTLGDVPPGWSTYPSPMRWTAMWRVPRYWNYVLRIGPGPAHLTIDGKTVLTVPAGRDVQNVEVALAQGDHFVEYDGTLLAAGRGSVFEWSAIPQTSPGQAVPPLVWERIPTARLRPAQNGPDGLFGVVTSEGRPEQHRLDGTLAAESLIAQTGIVGHPFTVRWTGTLRAPVDGTYAMDMFAQGKMDMRLDGKLLLHSDGPRDVPIVASVDLQAGPHPVEVLYEVKEGPGGIEWTWTPPGGERSVVPRFALTPPAGAGVGPALPPDVLSSSQPMPVEAPIELAR